MTNQCPHRDPDGSWSTWEFVECPRCEIDRLRAALEDKADIAESDLAMENMRLRAENERLRDGLGYVATTAWSLPDARLVAHSVLSGAAVEPSACPKSEFGHMWVGFGSPDSPEHCDNCGAPRWPD